MKLNKKQSMTLTEVLMAVAILTVVMAGLYASLALGNRTWRFFSETIAFKQGIRRAVYTMSQDLREAEQVFVEKTRDEVRLKYFKPKVGEISFVWHITGGKAGQLVKEVNTNERVLTGNVVFLDFDGDWNSVVLDIKAERPLKSGIPIRIELKQKIALRMRSGAFVKKETDKNENQQ